MASQHKRRPRPTAGPAATITAGVTRQVSDSAAWSPPRRAGATPRRRPPPSSAASSAPSASVAARLGFAPFEVVPGVLGPMTRYRRSR
jgi:hypothetical protein